MGHRGSEKSNWIPVFQRMHVLIKCQTDILAEWQGDLGHRKALFSVSNL